MHTTWLTLLVLCVVAIVALLLARVFARWDLPEVLAYLGVGIVLGPQVLGVLDVQLLERSAFIPQLLLGFVAFMVGEYLSPRALLSRKPFPVVTALLSLLLPFFVVFFCASEWAGAPKRQAITLGILAMAGAPATVLAIRQALGDTGRMGGILATLAALDNLLVVVLYAAAAPFLVASVATEWSISSAIREVFITLGAGTVLGLLGMWILAAVQAAEQNSIGGLLAGSLLVISGLVASSLLIGSSPLIACAVAGIGTATRGEGVLQEGSVFLSLRTLEHLVYVFFFVFAGAEIVFGHLFAAGLLALVYIGGRTLGKIIAAVVGGLLARRSATESLRFGAALLPQAGVVVGLALDAGTRFPYVGADIVAVVLAALVVFEFVGPFAVQRVLRFAPE